MVPGLGDCGDTAELDWASVASFPSQETSEVTVSTEYQPADMTVCLYRTTLGTLHTQVVTSSLFITGEILCDTVTLCHCDTVPL